MFSEDERISIVKTVGIRLDELNAHLTYLGELVTPGVRTAVLAEITAYGLIPNTGVEFYPTESNRGFKSTIGGTRGEIQTNIRNLLNMDSGNVRRLLRG